jgi:hypothetical protein
MPRDQVNRDIFNLYCTAKNSRPFLAAAFTQP